MEQYLEKGPGFIFLFHPALGPMWDIIAQKIRGGALMHGSEVVLEVRPRRTTRLLPALLLMSCRMWRLPQGAVVTSLQAARLRC